MYDVHSHRIENQAGGFLLSIEGNPSVYGGVSYSELLGQKRSDGFFVIPYINDLGGHLLAKIVYIHPRRNNFTPDDVSQYLGDSSAKVVIIDTFSSFLWTVHDYFNLLMTYQDKIFLLAHGGGYKIREFVELCRYCKNSFIDFSATHEIFGCVHGNINLDCGTLEIIKHALHEPRIKSKVLFGSDNPEFDQEKAYGLYDRICADGLKIMQENYFRLITEAAL